MKLSSSVVISLSLFVFNTSFPAIAGLINLGTANDYNVFIHQNFSATSSDVEGRMAVGGDINISHYSVNIKNGSQLYTDTSDSPALVAGGDLNFKSGQIAGDVHVGGTYTPTSSGNVVNGSANIGAPALIDFDAEFNNLINLSTSLSLLSPNAVAEDQFSTQYLTGAGANNLENDMHIFSLDSSDMLFSDYLLSNVDKGDTVLFNVSGTDISTSWGNFGGSDFSLDIMSENIIFNFYEAEALHLNASLYGSILAPKADITAPTGVIWGQVIANSWDGNMQINDNPFVNTSVKVPEPSSLIIFFLGLIALCVKREAKGYLSL